MIDDPRLGELAVGQAVDLHAGKGARLAPTTAGELELAARSHPPPPTTAQNGRAADNLPSIPTSFVGREWELATIPERLRTARVLTVTGVSGSGKTRPAIELGRHVAHSRARPARG
jgi:hypothetical protein